MALRGTSHALLTGKLQIESRILWNRAKTGIFYSISLRINNNAMNFDRFGQIVRGLFQVMDFTAGVGTSVAQRDRVRHPEVHNYT